MLPWFVYSHLVIRYLHVMQKLNTQFRFHTSLPLLTNPSGPVVPRTNYKVHRDMAIVAVFSLLMNSPKMNSSYKKISVVVYTMTYIYVYLHRRILNILGSNCLEPKQDFISLIQTMLRRRCIVNCDFGTYKMANLRLFILLLIIPYGKFV